MTEIAQLLESALRDNRSSLLRKAAIKTVSRMPATTTLRELMQSDACAAIRELTLGDLSGAISGNGERPKRRVLVTAADTVVVEESARSREERVYRQILDALGQDPLTIGQLGKQLEIETLELRGYLNWMKRMGKISTSGRARATRYFAVR